MIEMDDVPAKVNALPTLCFSGRLQALEGDTMQSAAKIRARSRVSLMTLPLLLLLLTFLAPPEGAQQEPGMAISVESELINIYQSTGVLVQMYTRDGEAIARQEITITTNLGTVTPDRAVTDIHGEAWVTFVALEQTGVSRITASARGLNETILVTVRCVGYSPLRRSNCPR